tara:strand:- start:240 stop:581 length:342 start_codon:yes stop_codon:yes gene_type:complete
MSKKFSHLLIASTLIAAFSSSAQATNPDSSPVKVATEVHAGADLAAAHNASILFSGTTRFLGSDFLTSASVIESNRVGTHVGVDIASAFASRGQIKKGDRLSASIEAVSTVRM